jgi:hypothetical protein
MSPFDGLSTIDRMVKAVELVRERLLRATAALEQAGVPYCVIGGNAVAAWVASVDPSATRNTQDVDLLVRRSDLVAVRAALEPVGFRQRHVRGITMFLDGDQNRVRDAVHLIFADETVRPDDAIPAPGVETYERFETFRAVPLDKLVGMKLVAYRLKDKVHLTDMLQLGMIDATWPSRFHPVLAARLQELLDHPEEDLFS